MRVEGRFSFDCVQGDGCKNVLRSIRRALSFGLTMAEYDLSKPLNWKIGDFKEDQKCK